MQWAIPLGAPSKNSQLTRRAKKNENQLDEKIGAWTSGYTAREVMEKLQAAGIRAGIVNTMKDVYTDPQLAQRPQWVELEHPEIGTQHYRMTSYQLSETPGRVRRAAPCLGQDNDAVLSEWLSLDLNEYQEVTR